MHGLIAFFDVSLLLTILPGLLGGIVAIVTSLIGYLKWKQEHAHVTQLGIEVGSLKQQLSHTVADRDQARSTLDADRVTHALSVKELENRAGNLLTNNLNLEKEVTKREKSLRHQENLARKMLGMEGEFWKAKALRNKPAFIPIGDRGNHKPTIFSVLNLKGGVGKTTLTANLGAAFASIGRRVLFIDVDLQGSLTSLLMPFDKIDALNDDNLLLQDFLMAISSPGPVNLLPYTQQVFNEPFCSIVPTSDRLAYADMNLMMTWMLRVGKRDSRFLLRRGLHQKRIFRKFDVILIDCPPFLNTSCINALAASDFMIIPVTPSENAVDRVPQLVYTLKHSIASLNPYLAIAGIVYNQTRRTQLSGPEQAIWNSVLKRAADQHGTPIRGFSTYVRNMTEIRDTEGDFIQAGPGTERYEVFRSLAEELLEVVPSGSNQVG